MSMSMFIADVNFFRYNPFLGRLWKDLSALPIEHQVAFGLYCCEQLYPFYVALSKRIGTSNNSTMRTLIDKLWQHLHIGRITQEQIEYLLDQIQGIDLGEEACCDEWDGAVDAVGAVSLTLETWRNKSAASAARAAGNVLNRVHQRLMDEMVGTTYVMSADETLLFTQRIEQHQDMKNAQNRLLEILYDLKQRLPLSVADFEYLRALAQQERVKHRGRQ